MGKLAYGFAKSYAETSGPPSVAAMARGYAMVAADRGRNHLQIDKSGLFPMIPASFRPRLRAPADPR
jgi:hypothetical protein